MNITTIAYSDIENELDDIVPEETEELEALEELEELEDLTLDDIQLNYIDPNTGAKSLIDGPSSLEANDGTKMLTGIIGVSGVSTSEQMDRLSEKGLLDKVIEFINRDPRLNIDINSLIMNNLSKGVISFIISPSIHTASSCRRTIKAAKVVDQSKIDKVCKDFFSKFSVGKDLSDFNINEANQELFNLLERVAVHLNNVEKRNVMRNIRKKLADHNIKLIYIENNS